MLKFDISCGCKILPLELGRWKTRDCYVNPGLISRTVIARILPSFIPAAVSAVGSQGVFTLTGDEDREITLGQFSSSDFKFEIFLRVQILLGWPKGSSPNPDPRHLNTHTMIAMVITIVVTPIPKTQSSFWFGFQWRMCPGYRGAIKRSKKEKRKQKGF